MSQPSRSPGFALNGLMILGGVFVIAGAVLALALPDLKFWWFEGRPLGILLVVVGVLEFFDGLRRSRGHAPRGILDELKEDIGLGPKTDQTGRDTTPQDPAPRDQNLG